MSQNNMNNNEAKRPSAPPMVQKKEEPKAPRKKPSKKLLVIIPVIIAIVAGSVGLAVFLKNNADKPDPIILTDENGIPYTDIEGNTIMVIPETVTQQYTDKNGVTKVTAIYKDVEVTVHVTDGKGAFVTDSNGEKITEIFTVVPTTKNPDAPPVVGTTSVVVTDGTGNTGVDDQGNVLTTIVPITENPFPVAPAEIVWKASLGGTAVDYYSCVESLSDGGYIASLVTNSTDGDLAGFKDLKYRTSYSVLVKYDSEGKVLWQKAIGSKKGVTILTDIVPLADNSFFVIGYGEGIGGVRGKGYYDGVVYKFNANGEEEWHKTFGTSTVDTFNAGTLTSDGGVVVVGAVGNNDKDAAGFGKPELKSAMVIVKYAADGSLVWKNVIGGNTDVLYGVVEGANGDIYAVGNVQSGELAPVLGLTDSILIRFNKDGKVVNTVSVAGENNESFKGIAKCKDGGIAIVGRSNSADSGTTKSMFVSDLAARGGYDSYLIKFNEELSVVFGRALRGQYNDDLTAVVEKEDGSFIVAGSSNSSSRDFKGITTRGGDDMVIASFDSRGSLTWARSFGGTMDESTNAICLAKDGGYIIAGRTQSKDIDMEGIATYVVGKPVGVVVKFPE